MKRKCSQIKDLKNGEEQVRKFYDSKVEYFSNEFKISKKDFPKVKPKTTVSCGASNN